MILTANGLAGTKQGAELQIAGDIRLEAIVDVVAVAQLMMVREAVVQARYAVPEI